MKKLTLFLLSLLALSSGFQACDNGKTCAEMLREEKDDINDFIKDWNIKAISQSEFYRQDSTTGYEDRGNAVDEYAQLTGRVYVQIVDEGSENEVGTMENNDQVPVRFVEYSTLDEGITLSNLAAAETVDEFRYAVASSSIAGTFLQGYMMTYYSSPAAPAG